MGKLIKLNQICQNNFADKEKGFIHNLVVHKLVMPAFVTEKFIQGSTISLIQYFGETAGMQCSCNALLVVCCVKFCKVTCCNSFDLDFVLDLGDNLFKSLGLYQYWMHLTCLNI